eukprot:gene879-177_t
MHSLFSLLCMFMVNVCCTDLLEQSNGWEVGEDLSIANELRKSLSVGWHGKIKDGNENDLSQDSKLKKTGTSSEQGIVKKVAEEVNKLITSDNPGSDDSLKFKDFPDDVKEKRLEIIDKINKLNQEKEKWKKYHGIEIEKYFPGIGTDCLYLKDDEVMKVTETRKKTGDTEKITIRQTGKYFDILKEFQNLKKNKISILKKEKRKLEKEDSSDASGKIAKLNEEVKKLSEKPAGVIDVKDLADTWKTSVLELRKSLTEVFHNVKKEGKNFEVDMTSNNKNIPDNVKLRDVLRVLQGYQDIARERIWDKTKFKVGIGGEELEFYLKRAPLGYYQIFYEMTGKDETQKKMEKKMKYKSERLGTQYKDILSQIDKIEVKGDDVKTREMQVKVAKFMLENLDNKIREQNELPDIIPDFEDPSKAKNKQEEEEIVWRNKQRKNDMKKTIGDLSILVNVVEAAPMPQKQLEYFSSRMKDDGYVLDTSKEITEIKKLPGAVKESYMSAGRTIALNSQVENLLKNFIEDPKYVRLKDLFLSQELFPAHIKQEGKGKGGTFLSKEWASKNKDAPLLSTLEFGALDASVDPTPGKSPESLDSSLASVMLTDGLINKRNFDHSDTLAKKAEDDVNKARKRTNSRADQIKLAKNIKTSGDVESESKDDPTCVSKRQICSFEERKLDLDENSIKIDNDILTYKLYDVHDKNKEYTVKTKVDVEKLSSVNYGKEQDGYAKKSRRSKFRRKIERVRGPLNTAFGIHGTLMSTFSAISSFEKGDVEHGAISTIQASHSLGSLTGFNEIVEKVSKKFFLKAVAKGAEKAGLTKVAEKASAKLLKIAEEGSERLIGNIPYVGLVFDAYFIAEDIIDLKKAVKVDDPGEIALDSVHLILDIASTFGNVIVGVFGPEFEPFVWAISLVRMAIDDFYIDISSELKKAHSTGDKILAFFKGLGEGFVDFLTGGLRRSLQQLKKKKKSDDELLSKFSNTDLYFNISSDCKIDFTSGNFSSYGGSLKFKLNDDDSFNVTISGVPVGNHQFKTITTSHKCPGLKDIILGIGELPTLQWKTQRANLWGFLPVASEEVIEKFLDDQNSLYGSYTGNKKNNEFIAFQGNYSKVLASECKDPDATGIVDLRLKNYFYILNGMEGNDSFFLGPQTAQVTGGLDHDLYYLGTHGGNTIIDNFAYDKLSDTLWLNVTHDHVVCGRKNYDLLIQYCGTHFVQVKNWFYPVTHDFQRHIVILTRDGIQLKVKDLGFENGKYVVDCVPFSIDRSHSDNDECLVLNKPPYTEVVTITGGTKNDVIIGNKESNFINAGPGENILIGGEGEDTYIIKPKGGCDHISNFAKDNQMDKLFIPINFKDIHITASSDSVKVNEKAYSKKCIKSSKTVLQKRNLQMDLKISFDLDVQEDTNSLVDPTSCVYIQDWFKAENYRHMTFVSNDDVAFNVVGDQTNTTKKPFMLDFSFSNKSITCNLSKANEVSNVQTIIDSFLPDTLIGNDAPNFISSHGNDFIQGNGGSDAYKIAKNCLNTVINNYDIHLDNDIIYIDQDFKDIELNYEPTNKSLEIDIGNNNAITLLNWFQNKTYRHASLRTTDGYLAILPDTYNEEQVDSKLQAVAIEISLEDEDCSYGSKTYDLSQRKYMGISKFTAMSDKCSYNVTGNSLNNHLDPGPGNPYGVQLLEGGNGSDTYVIGANYGEFNEINNYANDSLIDFVLLSVEYAYIEVDIEQDSNDIIVTSTSSSNLVNVRIKNFFLGKDYQHIVFQSADHITFRLLPHFPHKKVMIIDYSHSQFSQKLNTTKLFPRASVIYGSKEKGNVIYGSTETKRLVGGNKNDIIKGGESGEQIEGNGGNDNLAGNEGDDIIFGGDGDDNLDGGEGNDVLSGGYGADVIDGGDGFDSVLLAGDIVNEKGVIVSLWANEPENEVLISNDTGTVRIQPAVGKNGDAEGDSYRSIEMVHGSMFNDIIVGNDENNILSGNEGQDILITKKGYDVLVGGLGKDIYNLTDASGWKIVNNYASDKKMDTILAGKLSERPCQYSYNDDLFIILSKGDDKRLTVALKEWYKSKKFQHITLEYYNDQDQLIIDDPSKNIKLETSVDSWVSYFSTTTFLTVLSYSSNEVVVRIGEMVQNVQDEDHHVQLNYVSENQLYLTKKLSRDMIVGSSAMKLQSGILGGVMISISLSYHRCNNVLAITLPVTIRTLPNVPTDIKVIDVSSVSLTIGWKAPSYLTDPNGKYYKYRCVAVENISKRKIKITTKKAETSCVLEGLLHGTSYRVRVYSIIAGEKSQQAASIDVTTKDICKSISPPENGNIVSERVIHGKEYATVTCNHGYEMFATRDNWQEKIDKEVNIRCISSQLCIKWSKSVCLEEATCLPVECSKQSLADQYILNANDVIKERYVAGDKLRLSCKDSYEFENKQDTVTAICFHGKWKTSTGDRIPKCLPYVDCKGNLVPNLQISGQSTTIGDDGAYTVKHSSSARLVCIDGYEMSGPDQLTCFNGTMRPVAPKSLCRPKHCVEIESPSNGKARKSPSGAPVQDSSYTFSCDNDHWLDGHEKLTCRNGNWQPATPPTCKPKPCNFFHCQNGGTCHNNVNNKDFSCSCTSNYHGLHCETQTLPDNFRNKIDEMLKESGGCKAEELYNYLSNPIIATYYTHPSSYYKIRAGTLPLNLYETESTLNPLNLQLLTTSTSDPSEDLENNKLSQYEQTQEQFDDFEPVDTFSNSDSSNSSDDDSESASDQSLHTATNLIQPTRLGRDTYLAYVNDVSRTGGDDAPSNHNFSNWP